MKLLSMAARSLYNNKLRTSLSALGVIIGVSTIVLVVAIGLWAQKAIEEQYANLAVTSVLVNPVTTPSQKSKLSGEDVEAILAESPSVSSASAILQGKLLSSGESEPASLTVLWVGEWFQDISRLAIQYGEYWSAEDSDAKEKVAVLWDGAAAELFQTPEEAVGKTVSIGKKKYRVSGIFKKSGSSIGPITYDDSVFLPLPTAESLIGDSGSFRIVALASSVDVISAAIGEIGSALRNAHKLKPSNADDFRIVDQGSKVTAAKESANTMTLLLTGVAVIVLVVSGIGIMNVMFAWVAERTKEIGILKSVGIRTKDVLGMFLWESVVLSISGWIVGIALGDALIPVIRHFDLIAVESSFYGRIGAFAFAVLVGVFFGYYPAFRASKLDPVDALRS